MGAGSGLSQARSNGGGGTVTSVNSGTDITVDNTDPANPIVNFTGTYQDPITVVANYAALPAVGTVTGQFFWCSASQGTKWLPGSLGGTYYSAGMYYSNGVSWEFVDVPYQATQAEVNTGTNTDKFVTPETLTNAAWVVSTKKGEISFTIDGQGGVISTGSYSSLTVPYSGTITGWEILEVSPTPVPGSIVVDIWKDTYANYPPTVADTIFSTKPTLTTQTKNQNLAPTFVGAGATVTAGDIFKPNVDSATSVIKVQVNIFITKS